MKKINENKVSDVIKISENPGRKFIELSIENNDDNGFRGIPPWLIWKSINNACMGSPIEMKTVSRGTKMMVECRSREMAVNLSKLTFIQSRQKSFRIKARENLQLGVKQGAVYMPDLANCEDEDADTTILNALKNQNPDTGIENFRRLKRKVNGHLVNTGTLVINFRSNTLPTRISCFYLSGLVREFLPDPMRCFRCLKFGHTAKFCKKKEEEKLCVNCGDLSHTEKGVMCTRPSFCIHCDSNAHNSASRICPAFIEEKSIVQTKHKLNLTWQQARAHFHTHGPIFSGSYANAARKSNMIPPKSPPELHCNSSGIEMETDEILGLFKPTCSVVDIPDPMEVDQILKRVHDTSSDENFNVGATTGGKPGRAEKKKKKHEDEDEGSGSETDL
jgi:hypothetical protein